MKRALLLTLTLLALTACAPPRSSHIVIGAKDFTEQVILGELLAQEIEASGGGPVERRFWLAGSYLCQQALVSNRIDAYVEYTGTALTAILKQPLDRNAAQIDATITHLYAQRYNVRVFPSLGFNDTFAMVIRGADARQLHLKTISDILPYAPKWRLGVGYEFAERPDGLRGLSTAYNLHFNGEPRTMELGLLYRSLAARQVDIVAGNSTDGAIRALDFVALDDDRHYFPPYDAVPLVREDSLRRWPQIAVALQRLAGKITADEMRAMNLAVDGQHRDPADVVREFRASKGL
jgi:osmoprotectant transport system substrate-binding protein